MRYNDNPPPISYNSSNGSYGYGIGDMSKSTSFHRDNGVSYYDELMRGKYANPDNRSTTWLTSYMLVSEVVSFSAGSLRGVTVRGTSYRINGPTQGDFVQEVTSITNGLYPNNGFNESDKYWYVYQGEDTVIEQGDFVGVVHGDNPDEYPANGLHTDGYWYVRI